jgi:nucleotide-binding universal stress UspA family protein
VRTYLVVVDESPESSLALRFAARRAARTAGGLMLLGIVEPQDFIAFGGAQATMEAEAREHIEALVAASVAEASKEGDINPQILIKSGKPAEVVRNIIASNEEVAALVLGTEPSGAPGPLVAHFTGVDAGSLPCPVMIIPGGIDIERLDALS